MQPTCHVWMQSLKRVTQKAGKQVVITEPLLLAINRYQEQVRSVQMADHRLAVGATCHRVTQRDTELVEDAGLHQEQTTVFGLPGKDIFSEVLGQLQIGTGKRGDKGGVIVAILE
ncbi:hypothetical protein D3C73_1187220 [compost metagenome]